MVRRFVEAAVRPVTFPLEMRGGGAVVSKDVTHLKRESESKVVGHCSHNTDGPVFFFYRDKSPRD
jgi:hypothetical protein